MQKIIRKLMCFAASLLLLAGCEESKRYEISGGDSTPPGVPIFIDSDPLPGGARIYFRPPADEDLLAIEVSFLNSVNRQIRFSASYFTNYIDVFGFGSEGEHKIDLYAVDRSGNRSSMVRETVVSLEPPVVTVAKSVQVMSSFASILAKWRNGSQEPVTVSVDYSYTQNGVNHSYTRVFAAFQSLDIRSIDQINLYRDEPLSVKVSVKDKYDNVVVAKDTSIVLLTDELIVKDKWTLPATIGGIAQSIGLNIEMVIDGVIEMDVPGNYFITTAGNPWSIIIDLGDEYEISRIVTHQRWSGYAAVGTLQGNLYRGENVLTYNLYGWDKATTSWTQFSRCAITKPTVTDDAQYTTLGKAGDMFFLYPEEPKFSKPTRYLRFEADNGKYISEITLYGRKAN